MNLRRADKFGSFFFAKIALSYTISLKDLRFALIIDRDEISFNNLYRD